MSARYALNAADKMIETLDQCDELSASALAAALVIGCNTLHRLVTDVKPEGSLHTLLDEVNKQEDKHCIAQCLEDLDYFMDTFVFWEQSILIQFGASPKLVKFLFSDINAVRNVIQSESFKTKTLQHRLEDLENSICELKGEIKCKSDILDKKERIEKTIKKCIIYVASIGLIAINCSTDAITNLGLAPLMQNLSICLGNALISKASTSDEAKKNIEKGKFYP